MKIEQTKGFRPFTVTIETADEAKAVMTAIGGISGQDRAEACGFNWDDEIDRGRILHCSISKLYDACQKALR
jgi:hypothetical protein